MIRYLRDRLRLMLHGARTHYLRWAWGYAIDTTARISCGAFLDKTYPHGVHIGAHTLIARGAFVLTHDHVHARHRETCIGANCLIGVNAIVLPGVRIGDQVIIGAGAVVTHDIPAHSLAVGNPARVIRRIDTTHYGRLMTRDAAIS